MWSTVIVVDARDRNAALLKVAGVSFELSRRTLALCGVVIRHTYGSWTTTDGITNWDAS